VSLVSNRLLEARMDRQLVRSPTITPSGDGVLILRTAKVHREPAIREESSSSSSSPEQAPVSGSTGHEGERMTGTPGNLQPRRYEIRVHGHLGETIRSAFPGLKARTNGDDTVLTGTFADRAALYGVLAEAEGLGLELLEVRILPPHRREKRHA
jgi:hypothetical protein